MLNKLNVDEFVATYDIVETAALHALREYVEVVGATDATGSRPFLFDTNALRVSDFVGISARREFLCYQGMDNEPYELGVYDFSLPLNVLYEEGWAQRLRAEYEEHDRIQCEEIAELRRLREKYPSA